jgi:hypothetical protein
VVREAPLISVARGARVEGLNLIWTPTSAIESATYPVNICIHDLGSNCCLQLVGGTGGTGGVGVEVGGKGGTGKGPVISTRRGGRS